LTPLQNRRVLVIASAVGRSHLTRLILIARELKKLAAEVAFAYQNPQHELLLREGFSVYPVADAGVTDFSGNVYAAFDPSLIERCIQDELQAIRTFQPDLILADFRLSAAISARVAHIPLVTVVNGVLTHYFNPVETLFSPEEHPNRFKIAHWLARAIQDRQKWTLARPWREAARRHGIKKLASLYDFLAGDLTLVADLPQLCPLPNLPESVRYIGPLIWEGDPTPEKLLLPEPDPQRTLIYATAGNTGQRLLLEQIAQALSNDPAYQAVLTTGAFIDPAFAPLADNLYLARFIPGARIIPQAQAVIHSGGSGSTYQALLYGAPALVIPFNNEQRINAWIVQKKGLGLALSPRELTPQKVKTALETLLADSEIRQNVQKFQQDWNQDQSPQVAALRIGKFWAALENTPVSERTKR